MKQKIIEDGIVFSNDVERIINGKNALGYSYSKNGIIMPSDLSELRKNFLNDTNSIFNNMVTIISEEEMEEGIYNSIMDIVGRCPHCIFR